MAGQIRSRRQFGICILLLLLSSASILLVPAAFLRPVLTAICSLLFWGGMISGYVLYRRLRRRVLLRHRSRNVPKGSVLRFASNQVTKIADCAMIASLVLLIASAFVGFLQNYLQYVLLFVLLFSLHLHILCNGTCFQLLLNKNEMRETNETK